MTFVYIPPRSGLKWWPFPWCEISLLWSAGISCHFKICQTFCCPCCLWLALDDVSWSWISAADTVFWELFIWTLSSKIPSIGCICSHLKEKQCVEKKKKVKGGWWHKRLIKLIWNLQNDLGFGAGCQTCSNSPPFPILGEICEYLWWPSEFCGQHRRGT